MLFALVGSSQFCLHAELLTGADTAGVWQVKTQPIGESLQPQLTSWDVCVSRGNLPYGRYDLYYIVSTDCCQDTSESSFYLMDLGLISVGDFSSCVVEDTILISNHISIRKGVDAVYQFDTEALGYIDNGDVELDQFEPSQDSVGVPLTFTLEVYPQIPVGFTSFEVIDTQYHIFDIYIDEDCGCPQILLNTISCN